MRSELKTRIIQVCDKKIKAKGIGVGLSFYAFFANKNDDPELLICLLYTSPSPRD